ncbi:MAG: hypothetical protein N3G75_06730 [Methanothrix sp.]|nr:hypothetical protein [Methanothrix sp.]MCX8207511.1 hypothetical protein [Methanothrix sp.]
MKFGDLYSILRDTECGSVGAHAIYVRPSSIYSIEGLIREISIALDMSQLVDIVDYFRIPVEFVSNSAGITIASAPNGTLKCRIGRNVFSGCDTVMMRVSLIARLKTLLHRADALRSEVKTERRLSMLARAGYPRGVLERS